MTGGVVSRTVATSVSLADAPRPSSTVSVMVCVPAGSDTDAVAYHETMTVVLSDASGLLSATAATGATVSGAGTKTLTLSGSLAGVDTELATLSFKGLANDTYAPISTRAVPSKFPSTIRAASSRSSAGS